MKIDKGEISGTQFMFSVACFIQSAALLTAFFAAITLQDSWLVILFGFIVSLPLLWVYRNLMVMFPEQNLIQILDNVYGPVVGKILAVGYIWFFFTLTSINFTDLGDFIKQIMLKETPIMVLVIMCMLVSVIAVREGITLVTKYSTLFIMVTFVIMSFSVLLVINQLNFENFLPMLDKPVMKYVQGTHIITTIPFGETVVFLMIHPNVKQSRRETTKNLFLGFTLGGITVLAITMRDIATLGNTLEMFTLPHVVALSLANLGPALSRIEIVFSVVFIMLMVFRITFLYYVSVLAIAQLLKIKDYRHLALAIGTFMILYGLTLYPNPVEHLLSAQESVPFIWTPFEILIPVLTFVIAKIRKLPQAQTAVKEE